MSKLNDVEAIEITMDDLRTLIKEAVETGKSDTSGKNYFKETEILLYNYQQLKLKVDQDEEFLYDPDATIAPPNNRSKDIILNSGSRGHGLDIEKYTIGVKSSMMRTRQEVLRIERALETIKDDKYYDIVPMKYFDNIPFEEIADQLGCDEKTVRRNKNRLINRLKIMIFGADALPTYE